MACQAISMFLFISWRAGIYIQDHTIQKTKAGDGQQKTKSEWEYRGQSQPLSTVVDLPTRSRVIDIFQNS